MAKEAEFYKGRRKKKSYAIVPAIVILAIVSVVVVLFYGMQKYAVVTKDGVSVELPILNEGKTTIDSAGNEVKVFDPVDVTVQFDAPDYSNIKAKAGEGLSPVRAIFVPAENLTADKLDAYADRLSKGNALILEMKPRSGVLMWDSQATEALNYALTNPTAQTAQMPELIQGLKDRNIYLVAQISCCVDNLFASRSTTVSLRMETGANYTDDTGSWLDPYSSTVRNYIAQLAQELYDMGFDEVLLADVAHPTLAEGVNVVYNKAMSTTPGAVNAVCGFALAVADALEGNSGALSIWCYSRPALVKADETTGQDARLFMKIYDRVYLSSDNYAYPYNVADIQSYVTIGSIYDRLVPVINNNMGDQSSWVLVDVAAEDS